MIKDTDYAYAVGRIRVLEKGLLDRDKIDRMIEAKNAAEAFAVLNDSAYKDMASGKGNSFDYDNIINHMLKQTYDLLQSISPNPDLLKLFLERYDFHNIKVIIKSHFLGKSTDDLLIDIGNFPISVLKKEICERNYESLPEYVVTAITEAIERFNVNKDPQQIDMVLDKAMYNSMIQTAKKLKHPFLTRLVELYVDLHNIKTYLRIINKNNKQKYIDNALINRGTLSFDDKLAEASLEEFIDYLNESGYGWLITNEDFNWVDLERNMDNAIISFVKKQKYVTLGIEPLVGYLLAKENEARIARIILVGKLNGFAKNEITERVRDLYV